MDYLGIGFSNIRLPNSEKSYTYQYNYRINTFPEEVFVHEFLHTLERNSKEKGYDIPALHDYLKYGYMTEDKIGLKRWYVDYMNCNIDSDGKKIGLYEDIYLSKPLHSSNFEHTIELEFDNDSNNLIGRVGLLFKKLVDEFQEISNLISKL